MNAYCAHELQREIVNYGWLFVWQVIMCIHQCLMVVVLRAAVGEELKGIQGRSPVVAPKQEC